jgi:hypothetical protein
MHGRKNVSVLTLLGTVVLWTQTGFGQVFVEGVFPPSVVRGETTRITLSGSDMHQAVGLWASLPKKWVRATLVGLSSKHSAAFDVEVAPDAPLGLYGLRLATAGGLSNAHLFLIDDLKTIPEVEQSVDRPSSKLRAQQVTLPVAVVGICRQADVDRFAFDVTAGQTVSFEIVANRLGKFFDPLVTIRNSRGRIVIERDNDVGLFFDARFAHAFREAGRYSVEIRDSRFRGSDHWGYVLRMGRFPVARVALPSSVRAGEKTELRFPQLGSQTFPFDIPATFEADPFFIALRRDGDDASAWIPLSTSDLPGTIEQEPNDAVEQATAAVVPGLLHGVLHRPGDADRFAFDLKKGQTFNIRSASRVLGSPADLVLVLFDQNGKELKRSNDSGFDEPAFGFTATGDGRYILQVSDLINRGGSEFVYRIELRTREPKIELASGVTRLAIPQGTYQPLPLTLNRIDFSGPIELELIGAPAGVKLKSRSIPDAVGEVTNAILVDRTATPGVYTVQVVARGQSGDRQLKTTARTQPLVDRLPTGKGPHGEPFALQDNQRMLPPTLSNRIALLITPRAPFDFELADEVVELPRFLHSEYAINTTRIPGFEGPIRFVARGGELERDRLRQARVKSFIPVATAKTPVVMGQLSSGVLSSPTKHRVTVTGTVDYQGHIISLTRTFELDMKPAFHPSAEPARIELKPGASATVRIAANRLAPFDGKVTISPSKVAGISLPETIDVGQGTASVEVELTLAADIKPGTYTISLLGTARVNKFQESAKGEKLQVIVQTK